ncbi:MAG: hypothetical protein WC205_10940 [Opitutaceae bacterium]|jgi:hypothetical protein
MSTSNSSSVRSVESLRAALSQAQSLVSQLESVLAAAEESAATEAVLAMVEDGIPAEPVPVFTPLNGGSMGIGPVSVSDCVMIARDAAPLARVGGGFRVYVRAFGRSDGRIEWCGFCSGRWDEVAPDDWCSLSGSWFQAVCWARQIFAKYSAGVVAIAA